MAKKKGHNGIKYIFLFIIFLIIGIVGGYFVTLKFVGSNDEEDVEVTESENDVINNMEYETIIKSMESLVSSYYVFYDSTGYSLSTMNNSDKLILLYDYFVNNNLGQKSTLNTIYYGASYCANSFLTNENGVCDILVLNKADILEQYLKLFNDSVLTFEDFSPSQNVKCVFNNDQYTCGTVVNNSGYTGDLKPVFETTKVILEDDDTLALYNKGYLVDTRSNKISLNSDYSNFYLHSSDSTDYYYELKSSDNLTFKHIFKKNSSGNYCYVSSEVVE